ncbi:MAG: GNAT family N-acetyltransferase [Devosiaceae bacterium]|nr:GNAT family N-acetyltransferase [Devosiaceae bacterium]
MISEYNEGSSKLLELQLRSIGEIYILQKDLDWALANSNAIKLQYKIDNELAGAVIVVNKIFRPWSALYFFATDPKFASHKVAFQLLQEAESLCTRPSLRLYLRNDGKDAINFFKRNDYVLRKIKYNHYRKNLDAHVFMKKL